MSLTPGTKLGQHEICEAIGAGGMGEVYRARDTKLGREVAIKVLPEALSQDKERLARFEREAKLLASLHAVDRVFGIIELPAVDEIIGEMRGPAHPKKAPGADPSATEILSPIGAVVGLTPRPWKELSNLRSRFHGTAAHPT